MKLSITRNAKSLWILNSKRLFILGFDIISHMEEMVEHRELDLTNSDVFISKLPQETIPLKAVWFNINFSGVLHKRTAIWNWPFDLDRYSKMFIDASLNGTHDFIERLPSPFSIIKDNITNQYNFFKKLTIFESLVSSVLNLSDFEFATIHELWLEVNGFKYEIIENKREMMFWKIAV